MKIAIVHDWFKANGGAEKVAGAIIDLFTTDELTIYTLFNKFNDNDTREILKKHVVKTSLLQLLPGIEKYYRYLLPVMPWLIEQFKIKHHDIIISTSHAVAKSIGADPSILNICYCHSPMRYAWDMYDDYVEHHLIGKLWLYRRLINVIRKWDYDTAKRVHYFIANSNHIKDRIQNSYGRTATVIYPPVRTQLFKLYEGPREPYYLCYGRFVPYKKIDLIVNAFTQMPDKQLLLIGEGYGSEKFKKILSTSPNVKWLGYQNDSEMLHYIQEARACIFAAKEDFGIACVEVQACGTPVLALRYGGYCETVVEGVSGYFFNEQTEDSIINSVQQLEQQPLTNSISIRENAMKFSEERFADAMRHFINNCYNDFYKKKLC